jgi:hypothetical protein
MDNRHGEAQRCAMPVDVCAGQPICALIGAIERTTQRIIGGCFEVQPKLERAERAGVVARDRRRLLCGHRQHVATNGKQEEKQPEKAEIEACGSAGLHEVLPWLTVAKKKHGH